MANLLHERGLGEAKDTHGFFEDFYEFVTADFWTKTVTDVAGGVGIVTTDGAGGILTVGTEDATDNDEVLLESTREAFLFAASKPLHFAARIQYAEANTDDANVFVGLMDAAGADAMLDNGAGPKASYTGIGFFKVDGGTTWQTEVSIAGTQTTTDLTALNSLDGIAKTAGGASYTVLEFTFKPFSSTQAYVDFFIDGVHVQHLLWTYTSATEVQVAVVLKNGGANAEVMLVDWISCYQKR